jgi:hypothetical protein
MPYCNSLFLHPRVILTSLFVHARLISSICTPDTVLSSSLCTRNPTRQRRVTLRRLGTSSVRNAVLAQHLRLCRSSPVVDQPTTSTNFPPTDRPHSLTTSIPADCSSNYPQYTSPWIQEEKRPTVAIKQHRIDDVPSLPPGASARATRPLTTTNHQTRRHGHTYH